MKIAILYGSHTKLTNAHKLVSNHGAPSLHGGHKQPEYFVRMDTVNMDTGDLCDSLELAKPMDGETVLNTIRI